jgi:predicted transcriptional regulator
MRRNKELAELKDEIARFRNETKQRLDLIEHELNKYIALNYLRIIVDYMGRTTIDFIKSLNCRESRQYELECKEEIIEAQQKYIDQLKLGNLSESNKALGEVIDITRHIEQKMTKKGRDICAACCRRQINMLMINKSLLNELIALKEPPIQNEEKLEIICNVNPSELDKKVRTPLSHEVRLQIMLSIFKGNNRFAHFIEATGLSGGHLLYHVNKLIEHGFIQQYYSKDYGLTKKGMRVLLSLAQLNKENDQI